MSAALIHARAQLEGWIVNNVNSAQAEELVALVADMIEAERDVMIATNALLRESWHKTAANREVEMYSLKLAEKLIAKWRAPPTAD